MLETERLGEERQFGNAMAAAWPGPPIGGTIVNDSSQGHSALAGELFYDLFCCSH